MLVYGLLCDDYFGAGNLGGKRREGEREPVRGLCPVSMPCFPFLHGFLPKTGFTSEREGKARRENLFLSYESLWLNYP